MAGAAAAAAAVASGISIRTVSAPKASRAPRARSVVRAAISVGEKAYTVHKSEEIFNAAKVLPPPFSLFFASFSISCAFRAARLVLLGVSTGDFSVCNCAETCVLCPIGTFPGKKLGLICVLLHLFMRLECVA
jgi:hypothetical protein